MANILIVVGGLKGLLLSSFELAHRLVADGHEVSFASPAAKTVAPRAGDIAVHDLPASDLDEFRASDRARPLFERLTTIQQRRGEVVESLRAPHFSRLIAEHDPDLLLVDIELHHVVLEAIASGRRTSLLNTWLALDYQPGLPPLHTGLTPDEATAATWAWRRHWFYMRRKAWAETVRDLGADWKSSLLSHGRRHGVDLKLHIDERQWLIPFSYRRLPTLCLHAAELDFPRLEPAQHTFVGPMVARTAPDTDLPPPIGSPRKGPIIYGGFGSFFTIGSDLLERLYLAFEKQPDWTLVVTRGGEGNGQMSSAAQRPPPNVFVYDWLPQCAALEHCDAAIIHGGINTIDECVMTETPMLIYSGGITDMDGNAARVAWHGLGRRGDAKGDTADKIVAQLQALLTDRDLRTRLATMRAIFDGYRDRQVAEKTVRRLLAD